MSEKQELIKKMLEMQQKFMDFEHEQGEGLDPQDYYSPESGHTLDGYRQQYRDAAMKVVDLAHADKGSKA